MTCTKGLEAKELHNTNKQVWAKHMKKKKKRLTEVYLDNIGV